MASVVDDVPVPVPESPEVRVAVLDWLRNATMDGEVEITRERLANDFFWRGERLALIDRGKGIRKPLGWSSALSVATPVPKSGRPRPYDDDEGADGLHRYKLRRDSGGSAENDSLRVAMRDNVPLIWFYGVAPSLFRAIFPVYLLREETLEEQFVMALTPAQRAAPVGVSVEEDLRRYLIAETRRRLHQPVFASQVMRAYTRKCAVCAINHRELLDAAHIIPDADEGGLAAVSNGIALCKIHHAGYDRNILGIRPDLVVEIKESILAEVDGPMLKHGFQELHNQRLMVVPQRVSERPDADRLEQRYAQFIAA